MSKIRQGEGGSALICMMSSNHLFFYSEVTPKCQHSSLVTDYQRPQINNLVFWLAARLEHLNLYTKCIIIYNIILTLINHFEMLLMMDMETRMKLKLIYTCAQCITDNTSSMDKKYTFYPRQRIKRTMVEVTVVRGSDSVKNDIIQFDSLVTLMGQVLITLLTV